MFNIMQYSLTSTRMALVKIGGMCGTIFSPSLIHTFRTIFRMCSAWSISKRRREITMTTRSYNWRVIWKLLFINELSKINKTNNKGSRLVHLLTVSTQPTCLYASFFDRFMSTAQHLYVIITGLSITFRAIIFITVVRTF